MLRDIWGMTYQETEAQVTSNFKRLLRPIRARKSEPVKQKNY